MMDRKSRESRKSIEALTIAVSAFCVVVISATPFLFIGILAEAFETVNGLSEMDFLKTLPEPLSIVLLFIARSSIRLASGWAWVPVEAAVVGVMVYVFFRARASKDAPAVKKMAAVFFLAQALLWADVLLLGLATTSISVNYSRLDGASDSGVGARTAICERQSLMREGMDFHQTLSKQHEYNR